MDFKKILLGSAIFAAGFGLIACGDDSSSGSDPSGEGEVQKEDPIKLPEASKASPIIFKNLSGLPMAGENDSQELSISGSVDLDFIDFEDPTVPYTGDADMLIDSVQFLVGWNDAGVVRQTKVKISTDDLGLPKEKVLFSGKKFNFDQLDTNYGDYKLYVIAYAHYAQDGLPTTNYVSIDSSITFEYERPVEIQSSSAAACVEMVADSIVLSNQSPVDQKSLNFDTKKDSPAHITLQFEDGNAQLKAGDGVEIWEAEASDNVESSVMPTAPVCASIFKTAFGSKLDPMDIFGGSWYIAKVGSTEYPFMAKDIKKLDGKGSTKVVFFKKK